jgi:ATP-dependent DNA helicase RecG
MISEAELLKLLAEIESFRVEHTIAVDKTDKFAQAICAFANDMAASGLPGYLLIGADDKTGTPSGLQVTDQLLQNLSSLASNGNILPAPALIAYRVALSSGHGEIAVVEVQPSNLPPVRYKGQAWIRRGPAKGIANEAEKTILIERRTAAAKTFDAQPCIGASLSDLALDLFTSTYRPQAIDAETIAENHRPIENQLASLRFFDFDGIDMSADPLSEKCFQGDLLSVIRDLNSFVSMITSTRPARSTPLEEKLVSDYPEVAVRELLMNAICIVPTSPILQFASINLRIVLRFRIRERSIVRPVQITSPDRPTLATRYSPKL